MKQGTHPLSTSIAYKIPHPLPHPHTARLRPQDSNVYKRSMFYAKKELHSPPKTNTHPLLRHHINIPPTPPLLLRRPALPRRRHAQQVIDRAGIAHARRRPAGRTTARRTARSRCARSARRATGRRRRRACAVGCGGAGTGRGSGHGRRHARAAHAKGRGRSADAESGRLSARRRAAGEVGHRGRVAERGTALWWGRRGGGLSLVLRAGLLVDPLLEVRVVVERVLLAELRADGFVA